MPLVWVTGAMGFLGSAIVRRFATADWIVGALGRSSPDVPRVSQGMAPISIINGRSAWRSGTVSIPLLEDLATQTGVPDVLVHAAGSGTVGLSLTDPWRDFQNNVESTASVLEFVRRRASHARVIYLSSAAVYGMQPPAPIPERTQIAPISPYGYHKAAAELACRSAFENFGQPCSIIRYFSIYGAGLPKQLIWDIVQRIENGTDKIELGGTGDEVRDFIHVEDAADLVLLMAEGSQPRLQIVNGATGVGTTVRSVAQTILDALAPEVSLSFSRKVRPGDPSYLVADIAAARARGFAPKWSLTDGILDYVAWYRHHVNNDQRKVSSERR